mmetsp:Transcript_43174/g.122084  ORF Transcript_43174/g.122084 Transcript_43174/m.122084 type:complete len:213 (+) Transcript_43174:354-992(+)
MQTPDLQSSLTTALCPVHAARCSGVAHPPNGTPSLGTRHSASAPHSRSVSTAPMCPARAAMCNATCPSMAPSTSKSREMSTRANVANMLVEERVRPRCGRLTTASLSPATAQRSRTTSPWPKSAAMCKGNKPSLANSTSRPPSALQAQKSCNMSARPIKDDKRNAVQPECDVRRGSTPRRHKYEATYKCPATTARHKGDMPCSCGTSTRARA